MKGGSGTQGFSIKGSESFKAKGRVTTVNPLTVSFKDAEEKIVRAEKIEPPKNYSRCLRSFSHLITGECTTRRYAHLVTTTLLR